MFDFIVAFIIGLIPLILGISKKKIKFGVIGFVTCFIIWKVGTPLFGIPVLVIFIWLISKKLVGNNIYSNKKNADFQLKNEFMSIGIVIPILLTISAIVANTIGGYASFYIFLGTQIILLIIGSYLFFTMNKDKEKYQMRLNSGIVMVSEMISFIVCCAVTLVFIQFHLINSTDVFNLQEEFESFFVLAIFILGFSLLDISVMLLVTLGLKWFKK